jgi:Flp pilus assembly protein CpaB
VPWYAAAIGLTLLTAGVVHGTLRRADAAAAAYGETRPVVVATAEVEVGAPVDGDVAEVRRLPRAVVPVGALTALPGGRRALVALSAGEVVLERRISGSDAAGPAALLAPGERAMAIPLAIPGLPLAPGDRVDVVAGGAPGGGVGGDLPVAPSGPDVVATDAAVLDVAEDTVVIALDAGRAADVAAALTVGPLVLALRPP